MRVVLQRVKRAVINVVKDVETKTVGQIADGLLLLIGVTHDDTERDADALAEKILKLRLFAKDGGESGFDASVADVSGAILVVSQFTLYADCRKGTRPSFTAAARPEAAEKLYDYFVQRLIDTQLHVETGVFGAHMEVESVNDGPVTLVLDSR